jgi:hypothetical protein
MGEKYSTKLVFAPFQRPNEFGAQFAISVASRRTGLVQWSLMPVVHKDTRFVKEIKKINILFAPRW